jgi:hypothetical protein
VGAKGGAAGCGKEEKDMEKRRKRYEEENFQFIVCLGNCD